MQLVGPDQGRVLGIEALPGSGVSCSDEEAFWGDYFNGFKDENPWVAHAPLERLKERRPIEIFGREIAHRERQIDLGRPFMARFGDIARIEPYALGRHGIAMVIAIPFAMLLGFLPRETDGMSVLAKPRLVSRQLQALDS